MSVSFLGTKGPASIRYNNPGAQYPGPSSRKFGATRTAIIGGGHKIAVFPDAIKGAAAHFDLLHRSYTGKTLGTAIKKWSGGNSVATYLAVVRKYTGLSPADMLTTAYLEDPATGIPFAKAMAHHEAGRPYPLSDEQWMAAHALAFPWAHQAPETQVAARPPVPVPVPTPPAKEVLPRASRKWSILNWLKGLFGLGAGGTAGYSVINTLQAAQAIMGPIKAFATEWGVPMLIAVCVGGFVLTQLAQLFIAEDFEDGRYQPSKEG